MPGSSAAFASPASPPEALQVEPYPTVYLIASGTCVDAITAVAESLLAQGFDATLLDPEEETCAPKALRVSAGSGAVALGGATLHFDLDSVGSSAVTSAIIEHLLCDEHEPEPRAPTSLIPRADARLEPPLAVSLGARSVPDTASASPPTQDRPQTHLSTRNQTGPRSSGLESSSALCTSVADFWSADHPAANAATSRTRAEMSASSAPTHEASSLLAASAETEAWDMSASGPALEHDHALPRVKSRAWMGWAAAVALLAAAPAIVWAIGGRTLVGPNPLAAGATPSRSDDADRLDAPAIEAPVPVARAVLDSPEPRVVPEPRGPIDGSGEVAATATPSPAAAPVTDSLPVAAEAPVPPAPEPTANNDIIIEDEDAPPSVRARATKRPTSPSPKMPAQVDATPLVVPAPPPVESERPADASERLPDVLEDRDPTQASPPPSTPFLPLPDKTAPSIPETGSPLIAAEPDPSPSAP